MDRENDNIKINKKQLNKDNFKLIDKVDLKPILIDKKGKSTLQTHSIDGKLDVLIRVNLALDQNKYKFVF